MQFNKTGSCAYQEIMNLGCDRSAKDSMISFCRLSFEQRVKFGGTSAAVQTLYSFYLFSSAVKHNGKPMIWYTNRDYGVQFADFIKDNKLGDVWASNVVPNSAFHPDHSNQVWIWTPDLPKMVAWWSKNDPDEKKTKKPIVYECPGCGDEVDNDGDRCDLCDDGWDDDRDDDDDE